VAVETIFFAPNGKVLATKKLVSELISVRFRGILKMVMRLREVDELEYKVRFYSFADKIAFLDFILKMTGKWKVRMKRMVFRYDSPVANKCHISPKYAYIRLLDEHEKAKFIKAWKEEFEAEESDS